MTAVKVPSYYKPSIKGDVSDYSYNRKSRGKGKRKVKRVLTIYKKRKRDVDKFGQYI